MSDRWKYVERGKLESIAAMSLVNCHAVGVDSVLFDDTPGARLRAFIAQPTHDLWRNYGFHGRTLSVGLHPHHCYVVLSPIFGEIWNVTPAPSVKGKRYAAFKFDSPINGKSGQFVPVGSEDMTNVRLGREILQRPILMAAREIHTVYVPHGSTAAWYVREGDEDPSFSGLCWSDDDLTQFDFAPLYKPMSVDYLTGVLKMLKVGIR